jgi:dimethylhistidine N-methyltransferase
MNRRPARVDSPTVSEPTTPEGLAEILDGMARPRKMIPPKYFYDERGSELFDRICELPEYYLTRTELAIMRQHGAAMASQLGSGVRLIEPGSGSSLKTRILLDQLERPAAYVPVDISGEHLEAACRSLTAEYPALEVLPVVADFTRPFDMPRTRSRAMRDVFYFPGSTVGNFSPAAARNLLQQMRKRVGSSGAMLIGVDLEKDPNTLEAAYNDAEGVTAEFNLNMLRRINRDYQASFDLTKFRHRAVWNALHSRIEMHLVSTAEQDVDIAGDTFSVERGEYIVSEYSHKYTLKGFAKLAGDAGWDVHEVWTDAKDWFSVQLCFSR